MFIPPECTESAVFAQRTDTLKLPPYYKNFISFYTWTELK